MSSLWYEYRFQKRHILESYIESSVLHVCCSNGWRGRAGLWLLETLNSGYDRFLEFWHLTRARPGTTPTGSDAARPGSVRCRRRPADTGFAQLAYQSCCKMSWYKQFTKGEVHTLESKYFHPWCSKSDIKSKRCLLDHWLVWIVLIFPGADFHVLFRGENADWTGFSEKLFFSQSLISDILTNPWKQDCRTRISRGLKARVP